MLKAETENEMKSKPRTSTHQEEKKENEFIPQDLQTSVYCTSHLQLHSTCYQPLGLIQQVG